MAPEISIEGEMLQSVCIDDLKAIDVWGVLMTFFVILNPDQRFPFHLNIKEMPQRSLLTVLLIGF